MNIVDILISIVVVTILVTIILAIVTYVAYKLRLSREPVRKDDDPSQLRYFVPYAPPRANDVARVGGVSESGSADSSLERLDRDVAGLRSHATET